MAGPRQPCSICGRWVHDSCCTRNDSNTFRVCFQCPYHNLFRPEFHTHNDHNTQTTQTTNSSSPSSGAGRGSGADILPHWMTTQDAWPRSTILPNLGNYQLEYFPTIPVSTHGSAGSSTDDNGGEGNSTNSSRDGNNTVNSITGQRNTCPPVDLLPYIFIPHPLYTPAGLLATNPSTTDTNNTDGHEGPTTSDDNHQPYVYQPSDYLEMANLLPAGRF